MENMDEKKLWMKISGSINHYLRYYDKRMSDEELLEDYVEYVLGGENGRYEYLDKQTFEYIELSDEIVEKAINRSSAYHGYPYHHDSVP